MTKRPGPIGLGKSVSTRGGSTSGVFVTEDCNDVRPVGKTCVSYRSGHGLHWIHAKKSFEPQPEIAVTVTTQIDGRVNLVGKDLVETRWHHRPGRLQTALDSAGRVLWRPRWHLLWVDGQLFNLGRPDDVTACVSDDDGSPAHAAETALQRAQRHARERGGYTINLAALHAEGATPEQITENDLTEAHDGNDDAEP